MRAATALLPLFPDHDVAAVAAPTPPPLRDAAADTVAPAASRPTVPAAGADARAIAALATPTAAPTPAPPVAPHPKADHVLVEHAALAVTASAPAPAESTRTRAATLQQLANLWRADEVAHAAAQGATLASGFAELDAELPGGGWPQGQLIELLLDAPGLGELSLLAPALAQCAQETRSCVWVLPCERAVTTSPLLPYPPALAATGIDLTRALFVQPETPREAFWAIEQSLRAAHLGALLGWLPHTGSREGEFRALRRLQLLASRQQAPVFLLRHWRGQHAPTPAALRLQLAAHDGQLAVTILKRRGRPLLEPITLQVHPAHWRRAQVATAADGVHAAWPRPVGRGPQAALVAQRWSIKTVFSH